MPTVTVSLDGSSSSVQVGVDQASLRPFSTESPFNKLIPASLVLDANSASMVSLLAAQNAVANLYEFGTPVFTADANTPVFPVRVVDQWAGNFGSGRLIPIPATVAPSVGSDASCVILDPAKGVAYDFWQLSHSETEGWKCSYGTMFSLTGNGCPGFGATGSNMPLLACLTRAHEIEQGKIEHALSIATSHTAGSFRFPAFKTDGKGSYPPALPEGARVQLDPSINIEALPVTSAEKMIGRALQTYGAYVRNSSGSPFSIGFETVGDPASASNPYHKAGLTSDYFNLRLPWSKLRVLAKWDGT